MAETEYERKQRCLPKNRRQIGQPGESEPEVLIEDYAWMFGKGLSEREYTGCTVGVLMGESLQTEEGTKLLIKGILEAEGAYRNEVVNFTEEIWAEIYRTAGQYFPDKEIVGWYLGGPGFFIDAEEQLQKVHRNHFGGKTKVLLKMDSVEREYGFYVYRETSLVELAGYYIYYEKNTEMQMYMLQAKKLELPKEDIPDIDQKSEKEKKEEISLHHKKRSSLYRLLYTAGGMAACIAILAIAGSMIQLKEREELKNLLNEQSIGAMASGSRIRASENMQTTEGEASGNVTLQQQEGEQNTKSELTQQLEESKASENVTLQPSEEKRNMENGTKQMSDGTKTTENESAQSTNSTQIISTDTVFAKHQEEESKNEDDYPTPTEAIRVMTDCREYIIVKGDTLASICMKFYGTVEILNEIMRINSLSDRDRIIAGQTILLP